MFNLRKLLVVAFVVAHVGSAVAFFPPVNPLDREFPPATISGGSTTAKGVVFPPFQAS